MPDINTIANTIIRGEKAINFPLKLDPMSGWITDNIGHHILDVRGWGFIQYHSDGEEAAAKLQDEIGEWVVSALNKQYEEEMKLLNSVQV